LNFDVNVKSEILPGVPSTGSLSRIVHSDSTCTFVFSDMIH